MNILKDIYWLAVAVTLGVIFATTYLNAADGECNNMKRLVDRHYRYTFALSILFTIWTIVATYIIASL